MASETLGRSFDIHGGGPDLVFPHHENEIAQSEGAFKQRFANLWMHCGALRVGDDKMSKSLGNFKTIRDALKEHDAEVLRFFLIRTHYRSQINFTPDMIGEARTALTRLYRALDEVPVRRARSTGTSRTRSASRRRWMMTSTPRWRPACCSIWRARSIAASRESAGSAAVEGAGWGAGVAGAGAEGVLAGRSFCAGWI
jgi:cysteinyl-tRNA synthetase